MATSWQAQVEGLSALEPAGKLAAIEAIAADALVAARADEVGGAEADALRAALVEVIEADVGSGKQRQPLGELLGYLGDPRLRSPSDAAYWASLTLRSGDTYQLGRFAVTNQEFQAFVESGGYTKRELWSDEGWAWLQGCDNPWPELSSRDDAAIFLVPNQPVVGVSHHEASAYAAAHGARLPRWYERVWAVRGAQKRPYPWGSPFGEGNANTKEEVLGRPCAVGLYRRDCTPEGIFDLAGNAGEWSGEAASDEWLLHPGSWDQPSLAAWAKALTTEAPSARWAGLGFRLARDAE